MTKAGTSRSAHGKEILAATPEGSRSTEPKPTAESDPLPRIDENLSDNVSAEDEETDEEDDSIVPIEDSEDPCTLLRYVTSVLHSTESIPNLRNSNQFEGHANRRIMWVPLKRYVAALKTGVIYRQTENQPEVVELMEWTPNDRECDVWFAKATVIDLYRENRSRKIT